MEERVKVLTEKVDKLEQWRMTIDTRLTLAEHNISEINKKLDKIDANISKLLWIVIAFVIASVLGYVFGPLPTVKTAALFLIGG